MHKAVIPINLFVLISQIFFVSMFNFTLQKYSHPQIFATKIDKQAFFIDKPCIMQKKALP
jgi:hypothetical protein